MLTTWGKVKSLDHKQSLDLIEIGKFADLDPGDPAGDLKAIKRIRAVVPNGVVCYPRLGTRPFAGVPKATRSAQ